MHQLVIKNFDNSRMYGTKVKITLMLFAIISEVFN